MRGILQPARQGYNEWKTVNGYTYWVPPGYTFSKEWHSGFEVWATKYKKTFKDGMVSHYNLKDSYGNEAHVYVNAYNLLEIVPRGGTPTGF